MTSYSRDLGQGFTIGFVKTIDGTWCGKRADVGTVAIGSIATVLTPSSGKKFRLLGGQISVSAGVSVLFEDNSAGTANFIYRTPALAANTPFVFSLGMGALSSAADNVLKATSSGGANLTGTLFYSEE